MKKMKQRNQSTTQEETIDRHGIQTYWPTSIVESIQWFYFLNIMDPTADNIENKKNCYCPC